MDEQKPKRIADSRITLSILMGPQDVNGLGNVHGGVIMKMVDEAGALAAMRHAQAPVVTVAVERLSALLKTSFSSRTGKDPGAPRWLPHGHRRPRACNDPSSR